MWIAIRTDGFSDDSIIGDGTRENPWDGSTAIKFDTILNTFVGDENVCIHLGPGVFRTGGSATPGSQSGDYSKWIPRSGWKIIGSGQYQTILLLTVYGQDHPYASGQNPYWIIHSADRYLEGFELSDLTLDCGIDDQRMPPTAQRSWTEAMCAGFVLAGRNIVVRRVRIINFGTRAPGVINGYSVNGFEGYPGIFEPVISTPSWLTTAQISFNQVLEDCIFEQPYHCNGREVTPFHSSGMAIVIGATQAFAMRRCYFNLDFVNRLPYPPTRVARVDYTPGSRYQTIETTGPQLIK